MWVITKDHLSDKYSEYDRTDYKSYDFDTDVWAKRKHIPFRLYDDDGNIYYEGEIDDVSLNGDEDEAFAPLNFGEVDAGCTRMDFFENGKWQTL